MALPIISPSFRFASCIALVCVAMSSAASVPLIPEPAVANGLSGAFVPDDHTVIVCAQPEDFPLARYFQAEVLQRFAFKMSLGGSANPGASAHLIRIERVPAVRGRTGADQLTDERYTLRIFPGGVVIQAPSRTGVFYAIQSLLQLATRAPGRPGVEFPAVEIRDEPRFGWRGVLLDESRHFFGKATVRELLDVMAWLKLNRFHWHLTDEPGWRIEIRKYPRLTTVGALGNHVDPGAPAQFYTQGDIREIVAYAAERGITIVPEIDMPGHATAATRAYPEISAGGAPPWVGFTFNPAREETYQFLEDVLREVTELFPGRYVHLGGDEVHFGNQSWSTDPEIVAFTRRHGLKDAADLERYFIRRMARVVTSLGKVPMGWDEISSAGVPPADSAVIWWRHDKPEVLTALVNGGYHVVLSPRIPCYFDFVQDPSHTQGRRWEGEFNPLDRVYRFPEPALGTLVPVGREDAVMGIEACLWTETIHTPARLWFMALPRLAAFAEAAWTPATAKDWPAFQARLSGFEAEMARRGLRGFDPVDPRSTPEPLGPVKKPDTGGGE
jgi:hexosaminidase